LTASVALIAGQVNAGRPLTVDDANTNEKGAGHLEYWWAREPGNAQTFNIAPAYAPFEDIELSAAWTRELKSKLNATAIQAKWVVTKPIENGCNLGLVGGSAKVSDGGSRTQYANGLITCNRKDFGNLHLNLGGEKPKDGSTVRTWGVAVEREMGTAALHLEYFGAKGEKPTIQAGMRGDIVKSLQLDGTVGRVDKETVYSVGMKIQF
jgi:hypothetical protein